MEIVDIRFNGPGISPDNISSKDASLVSSNFIFTEFGADNDVIELHIYGESGQMLYNNHSISSYAPYLTTTPTGRYSSLTLDPEQDVKSRGFSRGTLEVQYNFLNTILASSENRKYYIKEISRSRTELRLASQNLANSQIKAAFTYYDISSRSANFYPIFYLNFGNNNLVVANNVAYTEDDDGAYILIKLYEPLPSNYDIKDQLWLVRKVAESVNFTVNIQVEADVVVNENKLRGPNYNVSLNTKTGQTTPYYTYNDLWNSTVTSSFQKLSSYYQDKSIDINVDYSSFSNFIKFSSATERLNNFIYKVGLIESSKSNILSQSAIVGGGYATVVAASSSVAEQNIIDNIINNFDTYEYFLYFNSSSWAWPKRNSTQPYELYSITSSQVSNFIGTETTIPTGTTASLLFSASYYDSNNKDILRNSVPQYIIDDPANQPFVTFLDMIGQHFDNLWIYYKDVTNRFNATNNPETGVSLDLVSDALKGLGFELFTNTNVSDNLYYTLFGINASGTLLPPTGSERITNYITSSLSTLPAQQVQDEIYKRLYHNLPYLYKTKGTLQSIKALISIYGIPETILSVSEFGGLISGSLPGVVDINSSDYKVKIITGSNGIVTGSLTISSSVLSPYTTIQYYQGNTALNSANIEVGFSPADVINNNITSSLPNINVEQLIGSPSYVYSSSYGPLVSASNAYFSTYTQRNSIWEYIRLLKFYNNSLFKTIKEFTPARANVSTGIIVKSHMLERNKYARHEPSMSISVFTQSIDIGNISGSHGSAIKDPTSWSGFLTTPLGPAAYSSSKGEEAFTGVFSGSNITVTDGVAIEQADYLKRTTGSYDKFNYGALYQNVTGSVRSTVLVDLDYGSNQIKPVNYGAVTYSLNRSITNAYDTYTNKNNPFAEVQDYNYNIRRSTNPRYQGSSVQSAQYSTYTEGDTSYGKNAAIDKLKFQYAYIVNIYSSSFQMPNRAKGQIKYLIDNNQNVINLSKTNLNIFAVQNIFKTGEYADVSLFDYDPSNSYIQRLNNSEDDFTIWESGYSYSPLLYNPSGSLIYPLFSPIITPGTAGTPSTVQALRTTDADYWAPWTGSVVSPGGGVVILNITASNIVSNVASSAEVTVNYYVTNASKTPNRYPSTGTTTIVIAKNTSAPYRNSVYLGSGYTSWIGDSPTIVISSETTGSSGTPDTPPVIVSSVTDLAPLWRVNSPGNILLISPSQSLYYNNFISTGSYAGLDDFVYPLNINSNDLVRLYNYSTSRWDQAGEFRVVSVDPGYSSGSPAINYVALTLDRSVPIQYTVSTVAGYPFKVERYLLLKRTTDETSIYFNYNLGESITQDGTLFPQYISDEDKNLSGNTIKALKQQNLI